MSENKTRPTDASVEAFLDAVDDDGKRSDARVLVDMMAEVTGARGVMWGSSIVGFGSYHYRYASGREGDFLEVGFSPRKRALTIYVMPGFSDYDDLLERLGKHTTGKSCLYVKRLSDIDLGALRELLTRSVAYLREKYPLRPRSSVSGRAYPGPRARHPDRWSSRDRLRSRFHR